MQWHMQKIILRGLRDKNTITISRDGFYMYKRGPGATSKKNCSLKDLVKKTIKAIYIFNTTII